MPYWDQSWKDEFKNKFALKFPNIVITDKDETKFIEDVQNRWVLFLADGNDSIPFLKLSISIEWWNDRLWVLAGLWNMRSLMISNPNGKINIQNATFAAFCTDDIFDWVKHTEYNSVDEAILWLDPIISNIYWKINNSTNLSKSLDQQYLDAKEKDRLEEIDRKQENHRNIFNREYRWILTENEFIELNMAMDEIHSIDTSETISLPSGVKVKKLSNRKSLWDEYYLITMTSTLEIEKKDWSKEYVKMRRQVNWDDWSDNREPELEYCVDAPKKIKIKNKLN